MVIENKDKKKDRTTSRVVHNTAQDTAAITGRRTVSTLSWEMALVPLLLLPRRRS